MCPWELFEEGLDSQQAAAEGPALESALANSLQQAVHTLTASHHFSAFHDLLLPDQAYPASDTGERYCCHNTPSLLQSALSWPPNSSPKAALQFILM